jgi:hypothetical protein
VEGKLWLCGGVVVCWSRKAEYAVIASILMRCDIYAEASFFERTVDPIRRG